MRSVATISCGTGTAASGTPSEWRFAVSAEVFHPDELEMLRRSCHDALTRFQAAVAQDEPLPPLQ
jgi:hypothetical protein